ncbi:MAG: OmpH family outer membrane protein [Planctomycetes bacterium]|nr:OmpH family outer membrane protein [Planctomycetota bacterium]
MKKMILFATGFAVLAMGAVGSSYLSAQQGGGAKTPQMQGTKVAVVNIGYVFSKYKRAQQFKLELEQTLAQPKKDAKVLIDQMDAWQKYIREKGPSLPKSERESIEEKLVQHKRKLEIMDHDIRKLLGRKSEQNLETLWKEVNVCITRVSEAYGFQIVFGYGDPFEKGLMDQFPNINRKMQAMDQGSTVPLYVHGSVDLSKTVADTLNLWLEPQKSVQPTSGSK